MDTLTALRDRRSINALTSDVPSQAAIQRLIDAAVWAPNHRMTEPWRFHVLAGDARRTVGEAISDGLRDELDANDPVAAGEIKGARAKLMRAPVVIVVSHPRADDPVMDLEDYAACCCAVQNMLLAAHAEGLGAKWRTGAMCEFVATRKALGLGDTDRLVGFIYLGYPSPNAPPDTRERATPDVDWLGWDDASG